MRVLVEISQEFRAQVVRAVESQGHVVLNSVPQSPKDLQKIDFVIAGSFSSASFARRHRIPFIACNASRVEREFSIQEGAVFELSPNQIEAALNAGAFTLTEAIKWLPGSAKSSVVDDYVKRGYYRDSLVSYGEYIARLREGSKSPGTIIEDIPVEHLTRLAKFALQEQLYETDPSLRVEFVDDVNGALVAYITGGDIPPFIYRWRGRVLELMGLSARPAHRLLKQRLADQLRTKSRPEKRKVHHLRHQKRAE
jgi:hypothetical protein